MEYNEIIERIRGHHEVDFSGDTIGLLTPDQAIDSVVLADTGTLYAWDDSTFQADIQSELGDTNATYYPTPELIFVEDTASEDLVLAYWIEILRLLPDTMTISYRVNAKTGSVLYSTSPYYGVGGTVTPVHVSCSVAEDFVTRKKLGNYILQDRGRNIHTKRGGDALFASDPNVKDNDNIWSCNKEPTAHWAAQKAYDAVVDELDFEVDWEVRVITQDDAVESENLETQTQTSVKNFIKKYHMFIGRAQRTSGTWLCEYDIIGHEFGHITLHSMDIKLISTAGTTGWENRSIEEAYCDIIGTIAEKETFGTIDWGLGVNSYGVNGNRNLKTGLTSNSESGTQTQIYQSANWDDRIDDLLGGYHRNAGVINKWFQLLVDSGTFNGISVPSLGYDKTVKLFRATVLATMAKDKIPDPAIMSAYYAEKFWGRCQSEWYANNAAWLAVGLESTHGMPQFSDCIVPLNPPGFRLHALLKGMVDPTCDIKFYGDGFLDEVDTGITSIAS